MSLIKCSECEKEISESARSCPHCGHEAQREGCRARVYPCYYMKYVFGFVAVALIFFLLGKAVRTII